VFISEENFEKIREAQTFVYGYYLDDPSTAGHVYTTAKANLYSNNSSLYKSVGTVCDVINVFDDFMVLITVVLFLICILLLIRFGFSNIRKNKYEIGVIFALGGNSKAIIRIFLSQILFVGALISIFSSLALFLLTKSTDQLIIEAMIRFVNDKNIATITIIEFIPYIVMFDVLMILGVTIVSAMVPTLYLRNMKPINIIKAKN
jgi:ABC-type antimicrobial peptide transport system permease subunit